MAKSYRVGVIGRTGKGDYGHGLDTVWKHVPNIQVVAVADEDASGRTAAAERVGVEKTFADYREMLDSVKPDIVAIGPRWLDRHAEMADAAAERGIHVFMEKPFCRSIEEADAILRACEMTHTRIALAHQTRYSPKLERVKKLIDDGTIGQVLELRGRGKEDARGGGEDLWVLGSHILNMIHYLAGAPKWCQAYVTEKGRPIERKDLKAGNEAIPQLAGDSVHAQFLMENGAMATFDSVRGTGANPSRFGLQILGSKGIIEIGTGYLPFTKILLDGSWSPGRTGSVWKDISSAGVDQPEPVTDPGGHGGNEAAVLDLLDAIENHREPKCGPREGKMTIQMILAVFQSQITQRPVSLTS